MLALKKITGVEFQEIAQKKNTTIKQTRDNLYQFGSYGYKTLEGFSFFSKQLSSFHLNLIFLPEENE